jgi:hypothetical protein
VTFRPACFRIEKKPPNAQSGVSFVGVGGRLVNSTQLMLHELLISPVVSARVADVALLTAY